MAASFFIAMRSEEAASGRFCRYQSMQEKGKIMSELRFVMKTMLAADLGEEACVPDLLGERILQNSLKFYLDETDEIYEGYGRLANAYPYRQRNNYTRQLRKKQIRTAVLENDRIKAVFLPDYGGRLWELWDKKENRNLLYTNDVLQFSNLAVRNAWFSGGVEWNLGIIGHHPFTTEPLYVARTRTEQGEPVLRMYEYERIRRVAWQMDFWLEEGCPYLKCRMRIVNESAEVIPMYWWSNMAVPEYEHGHITVPASEAYAGTGIECRKVSLPVVEGVDVSEYQKIPRSIDYFFNIPEDAPKYIVNVNKEGKGLLQFSTKRLQGRKLFSWGKNTASDHWQEFLTKDAGRYVEIQAGLGKTQYGCIPMAPHTAWEWMECYGPAYSEELSADVYEKSFEERRTYITDYLLKNHLIENLEEELKASKKMALTKAEMVTPGSGYGAFRRECKRTEHLEFVKRTKTMEQWEHFFETGELHCPDPKEEPDAFWNGEEFLSSLKKTTLDQEAPNYKNWYAYYHIGILEFRRGNDAVAKEMYEMSLKLEENAWALHGLACLCIQGGNENLAVLYVQRGMELQRDCLSYQKEGLKILSQCEAYGAILQQYAALDEQMKSIGRVQYYYVLGLVKTGRFGEADRLLNGEEGIMVDDVREGEDNLQDLWEILNHELHQDREKLPYRYDFHAN